MANDGGGTRRPSPAFADQYRRGVTNAVIAGLSSPALLCPGSTYGQTRRTGATPSSGLIDWYQGGFIEFPGMQRRATEIASRRKELQHKRTKVAGERTALALTTSGHVQIRPDIALDPPPNRPNRHSVTTPAPGVPPKGLAFGWWPRTVTPTGCATPTTRKTQPDLALHPQRDATFPGHQRGLSGH